MERRKSDVSDLRKLTMAEFGNTRILRKCGAAPVRGNRVANAYPSTIRNHLDLKARAGVQIARSFLIMAGP
jgi:hypothetical protein